MWQSFVEMASRRSNHTFLLPRRSNKSRSTFLHNKFLLNAMLHNSTTEHILISNSFNCGETFFTCMDTNNGTIASNVVHMLCPVLQSLVYQISNTVIYIAGMNPKIYFWVSSRANTNNFKFQKMYKESIKWKFKWCLQQEIFKLDYQSKIVAYSQFH